MNPKDADYEQPPAPLPGPGLVPPEQPQPLQAANDPSTQSVSSGADGRNELPTPTGPAEPITQHDPLLEFSEEDQKRLAPDALAGAAGAPDPFADYAPQPEEPKPLPTFPPEPLPADQPSKRRKVIIGGIIAGVLTVGVGVGTLIAMNDGADSSKTTQSGMTDDTTQADTITTAHPYFFFTKQDGKTKNQTISYIDAVTGKTTSQTIELNQSVSANSPFTALTMAGTNKNQSVQISHDSTVLAYSTVRMQGSDQSEPAPIEGSFSILAGSRTGSMQTIVAGKDSAYIMDWLLSDDGKYVYYLEVPSSDKLSVQEATLYSVVVNTGQSKKLGTVAYPGDRSHSRLYDVSQDHTIRFYSTLQDGLYQTTYDTETSTSARDIIAGANEYEAGEFGPLSPNGAHLMYTGQDKASNVITYRIGIESGEVQTIFDSSDGGIAYQPGSWTLDSKKIVLSTYPSSGLSQQRNDFPYQLVGYDVLTNQQTAIAEQPGPGTPSGNVATRYLLPSWSTDGRFVAYGHGTDIIVYNSAERRVVTALNIGDRFAQLDSFYGWVKQDDRQ